MIPNVLLGSTCSACVRCRKRRYTHVFHELNVRRIDDRRWPSLDDLIGFVNLRYLAIDRDAQSELTALLPCAPP